jgi:hypothetical protein
VPALCQDVCIHIYCTGFAHKIEVIFSNLINAFVSDRFDFDFDFLMSKIFEIVLTKL